MPLVEIAQVQAAVLHDALQKAIKVAPTKGAAFDRAQGIQLTFIGPEDVCEVRSTNIEVTYWQKIKCGLGVACGERTTLRLPASPLAPFVAGLPMSEDAHIVRFFVDSESPKAVVLQFMKSKIKVKMMNIAGTYPSFDPVDTTGFGVAQELASRLEQVSWATDDHGKMACIYLDGEWMVGACGKYAARARCKVETDKPVVAPLGDLTSLIKLGTDIRMGVHDNKLVIALDESSQVTTSLVVEEYPDVAARFGAFPLDDKMTIPRTRTIAAMDRLLLFVNGNRVPNCKIEIDESELRATLNAEGGQKAQDVVEITNQVMYGKRDFAFNPQMLRLALETFGISAVEVRYHTGTRVLPWHLVDSGGEYECWLMPLDDRALSEPAKKEGGEAEEPPVE